MTRPAVYLICWAHQPIGNLENRHGAAGHYLGVALDGNVYRRVAVHRAGYGAAIMRAVSERGIPFFVTRTWVGGRALERKLKRRKNAPKLCPACVPAPWENPIEDQDQIALDHRAEVQLDHLEVTA